MFVREDFPQPPRLFAGWGSDKENQMAKPPKSTPHSDLDGVHEDEKKNVDSARDSGQSAADLARARAGSKGRPPHSSENSLDDRS